MNTEIIAVIVSALATVLGAVFSAFASRGSVFEAVADAFRHLLLKRQAAPLREDGLTIRMQEARRALERQRELATTHRIAGSLLTFGQFVVGGLLASSFLQDKLSKEMIGGLGLLVLASSLIRQHYRPEIQYIGARQRAAKLKALIREAEDAQFAAREGSPGALPDHEIRLLLSQGLTQVEESELQDVVAVARSEGKVKETATKKKLADKNDET